MATANKVIEYVDKMKINAYGSEEKFQWLCELDGMVKRLVMQEEEGVHYRYPDDMDTQLLIPPPFEAAYVQYLFAQIDLHNKEYPAYNNSVQVFENTWNNFKRAFIREHRPKSAGPIRL